VLAELARHHADECWLDRRAYLAVAVALRECGSDQAARKAIASIGVAEVRRPRRRAARAAACRRDTTMTMQPHPYQVMPALAAEERAALRADIAERGVLVPVVTDQHGNILDGHHRKEIAGELGVTYRVDVVQVADDDEARSVARMYNLARRHLTREQKRDLIAEEIKAGPDRSDREIGRLMRCDHKTVGSVRRELSGEFPHPGALTALTALQRKLADAHFAIMRSRTLVMIAERSRYIAENYGSADVRVAGFGMFTLATSEDCEGLDRATLGEAWRRYTEWAGTSESTRGVLWMDPDDWDGDL
jgi:hypothetical protein